MYEQFGRGFEQKMQGRNGFNEECAVFVRGMSDIMITCTCRAWAIVADIQINLEEFHLSTLATARDHLHVRSSQSDHISTSFVSVWFAKISQIF